MQGDKMKSSLHNSKNLKKLLKDIFDIEINIDIKISNICYDSRLIKENDCFIALSGQKYNAIDFINDAINLGASCIIKEYHEFTICFHEGSNTPIVGIPNLQKKLGLIAANFFDYPSRSLDMVGITGTNGKSSLSFLIAAALEYAGSRAAFVGTIGYGGVNSYEPSERTTEPPILLQKRLNYLKQQKFTNVAMEVSSHAIAMHRIVGIDFNSFVFSNISPDHLDFHGDFNAYRNIKLSLFETNTSIPIILNYDDDGGKILYNRYKGLRDIFCYGLFFDINAPNNYMFPKEVHYSLKGTKLVITTNNHDFVVNTKLIGVYNVYNILAVGSYLLSQNYEIPTVAECLNNLPQIPGRMEVFKSKNSPCIIVDYAHEGEALKGVLQFLKNNSNGKIVSVFGCGGDRPITRRHEMGSAADMYADKIYLTEDNPRDEDVNTINSHIMEYIRNKNKVTIVNSRSNAITDAINSCNQDDVVLVSGKGHEQFQEIAGMKYEYSDIAVIKDLLQ
jgi:UDP-N-acetylmuramoyl-L-alanyl-D-glutamate--2,6-diaminopimelate ligase